MQQPDDVGRAGEQVVDELAAGRLLRPHQGAAGELVALGQRGDDVVDGVQHHLAGHDHASGSLGGARATGGRWRHSRQAADR